MSEFLQILSFTELKRIVQNMDAMRYAQTVYAFFWHGKLHLFPYFGPIKQINAQLSSDKLEIEIENEIEKQHIVMRG